MNIKDLVGYQLADINENGIIVKKNGRKFIIKVDKTADDRNCCDYNEIKTKLFIDRKEMFRNPVITNIEISDNDDLAHETRCGGDAKTITFFGESKPLAEFNSLSSSGSGWEYGATVKLVCEDLQIDEIVTEW